MLADAISDITGIADQYGDELLGTRAVALFDSNIESEALDILGRCSREVSCETDDEATGGLTRKLHLFNGPLINRRISDPRGRLAKFIAAEHAPDEIVDEFYRGALGRRPLPREREFWSKHIAAAIGPRQQQDVLEDFVWSLLTCREFVTNH